jgi:uncharacterized iron-regulated protein
MNRFFSPVRLTTILCLALLVGCSHGQGGKQLIGDPENPYPLASKPKIGDIVHLPTGILVSQEQMLAAAGDARIVYVGETHDNPASHRLQLQVLKALADRHPGRVALGMEMFTRSQQPALDRWVAGELDEKSFLKESKWFDSWKMDYAYYRDLLNFARERQIPVIALNAEKSLVAKVRRTPPDQLDAADRERLPEMDLTDSYQRALATAIFGDQSHGGMAIDAFVRGQTLWDEIMAESAARYLASPAGADKHLMVVAGGYHVSYGFGIPRRLFRRFPSSYVILGGREIDIPADKQDRLMDVELPKFPMVPFDFLTFYSYEGLPDKGVKLGVMFEPAPERQGLLVKNVAPGSAAEHAGLKAGDLLLHFDGAPLAESFDLIYAVRQKRQGDRAALSLERDGRTLEIEVVFRAEGQ